jgi:hypothetical protein
MRAAPQPLSSRTPRARLAARIIRGSSVEPSWGPCLWHQRPRRDRVRASPSPVRNVFMADKRPLHVLLAGPRGFCAGVDRAIKIVEEAISASAPRSMSGTRSSTTASWWRPWKPRAPSSSRNWTRSPMTASRWCSAPMACPRPSRTRRSGGGCSSRRHLPPRVQGPSRGGAPPWTRPHILMIGHGGHPEVIGTMGQLPAGAVTLVEDEAQARAVPAARGPGRWPSSPRPRFRWTTRRRSWRSCRTAFPASRPRRRRTSATPPPTGRRR